MFKKVILLVLLVTVGFAQSASARQDTAVKFLTWGVGARASGMGEAFCAVADDATAIHFNPGGLGFLRKPFFAGMYSNLYTDVDDGIAHSFLGYTQPAGKRGTFGLGLNYLNYGEQMETDEFNRERGTFNTYELSAILSLAHLLSDDLAIGANFKYIHSKLWVKFEGTAYAGDLGLLYKTPVKGLILGAAVENIGSKIYYETKSQADELPANVKIGAAYNLSLGTKVRVLLALDLNRPLYDDFIGYNTGAEIGLFKLLSLRAGYFDKGAGLKDYTYGFGANYKNFNLDFANVPKGALLDVDRNNRISLGINF